MLANRIAEVRRIAAADLQRFDAIRKGMQGEVVRAAYYPEPTPVDPCQSQVDQLAQCDQMISGLSQMLQTYTNMRNLLTLALAQCRGGKTV